MALITAITCWQVAGRLAFRYAAVMTTATRCRKLTVIDSRDCPAVIGVATVAVLIRRNVIRGFAGSSHLVG